MQAVESEEVSWAEVLTGRHGPSVLLCCLGVWLHASDGLVVTTMMPAIVRDIGGDRFVAWAFALYDTGTIVAGAASGLLSLRLGLRMPMVMAALLFALGCLLSTVAPTMAVMLAGRIAQGLGGGALVSLSFVAVSRLFPPRMMPRVMAALSVVWGASAFVGPLIGGLFVTWATWRVGFLVFALQALGLAAWFALAIRAEAMPPARDDIARLPWRRLLLLCLSVLAVAYAGITETRAGMALSLAVGVAALAAFARRDAASGADRLWPRGVFDLRQPVGAALVMIMGLNIATMGLATYGPLLLDLIHGVDALTAGYVVAAITIAWTLGAVLVSGQPGRRDPAFIAVGVTMVAASVAVSIHAVPHGPLWLIVTCAALEGFGYGMAWSFILRRNLQFVPPDEADRLSAAQPTIGRLGYALGAAVTGIFANVAGFHSGASMAEAQGVARMIFLGSLPFALLAWVAMIRFVTTRRQGS